MEQRDKNWLIKYLKHDNSKLILKKNKNFLSNKEISNYTDWVNIV